jgi:type I restriction-modification system DNA methylase subunit
MPYAEYVLWNNEGSFLNDAHSDLKADFMIANPFFNDSNWSGKLLRTDGHWKYCYQQYLTQTMRGSSTFVTPLAKRHRRFSSC